jgi:LacI family transcriptional regulator
MAKIVDVAKRAGVSPSTVSYVLNNSRFVSEETRAKILKAIQELNYRPSALARSLRKGETLNIGLILPQISNPYFAELGEIMENAAFELGYNLFLCNSEDDIKIEQHYLDMLLEKQVDGIVYFAAQNDPGNLQSLLEKFPDYPIVIVDRALPFPQLDLVMADNVLGGMMAVDHLIKSGHRLIACLSGPTRFTASNERIAGYCKALEKAGKAIDQKLIFYSDGSPASAKLLTQKMIGINPQPTAIFATNDITAIGVLRALNEAGLKVPDDMAVIGYDEIWLGSFLNPSLSTVAQPKVEIAHTAIKLVIERIVDKSLPRRTCVFPPQLIIRESTAGKKSAPYLISSS